MNDHFIFDSSEKEGLKKLSGFKVPPSILEKLISYIKDTEKGREVFRGFTEKDLERLKAGISRHLERLFKNPEDQEFIEEAKAIGRTHAKRGVSPSHFLGGFSVLSSSIIFELSSRDLECENLKPLVMATLRLLCYDASLILDGYFGLVRDDLMRAYKEIVSLNRIYQIIKEINKLTFEERSSIRNLLESACEILHNSGGFPLVWVGRVDPEKGLIPMAAYGETGYIKDMMNLTLLPYREFDTGLDALSKGKIVIIEDIEKDEKLKGISHKALKFGLRSAMIIPVFVDDEVRFLLFVYSDEPMTFSQEEIQLIKEISLELSVALMHIEKAGKLEKLLFEDQLTGLKNEKYMLNALKHEIETVREGDLVLALIRMDISNFSVINHKFGYFVGDSILREVGRRLSNFKDRSVGTVARIGPDEFALSCHLRNIPEIHRIILGLRELFEKPFSLPDGPSIDLEFSMGISFFPQDAKNAEDLMGAAGFALKRAKREADGGIAFYSDKDTKELLSKVKFLDILERALSQNRFLLYYQPKFSLKNEKPTGFEALLRLKEEDGSVVAPGKFISVLESSGLIKRVGYWVVEEVTSFLKKINALDPSLNLSFNISVNQFKDKRLIEVIRKAVSKEGVDPGRLQVEVTEMVLMEAGDEAIEILEAIRDMGIEISIDDFGTGFSSLVYLKRIPADTLKIDKSFVMGLPYNKEDFEIVRAIVLMARSLGKRVVAEGVERRDQLEVLKAMGIDEAQGFFFSKPIPEGEALRLIDAKIKDAKK